MSSTSTGVRSRQADRSGTAISTRRSPYRVLVSTTHGAPMRVAMSPAHCSLSSSGPTINGRSVLAAIQSANKGAACKVAVGRV